MFCGQNTTQCEQGRTAGPFYSTLIGNYFSKSTLFGHVAPVQYHSRGIGHVGACELYSKYTPSSAKNGSRLSKRKGEGKRKHQFPMYQNMSGLNRELETIDADIL